MLSKNSNLVLALVGVFLALACNKPKSGNSETAAAADGAKNPFAANGYPAPDASNTVDPYQGKADQLKGVYLGTMRVERKACKVTIAVAPQPETNPVTGKLERYMGLLYVSVEKVEKSPGSGEPYDVKSYFEPGDKDHDPATQNGVISWSHSGVSPIPLAFAAQSLSLTLKGGKLITASARDYKKDAIRIEGSTANPDFNLQINCDDLKKQ